ncbi:unnamed protein product [Rhizoctonia solani]|uniref:Uncharacterized protein n=1 Tax=Rhizoctonia solani TaxID=456999 RepID=A0A8H3E4C0_9AGAM|nr:unnamed protein product [Rhizoctonia solani]
MVFWESCLHLYQIRNYPHNRYALSIHVLVPAVHTAVGSQLFTNFELYYLLYLLRSCRTVEGIFVWSSVVIIIAGSSILIVRTWLLWGGEKWVLVALIGGLLVASGFSIYYVYVDALQAHIISINPPLLPGCIVRISPTVWRILVPPLFYQTFIIALGVTKVLMTPNRAPLAMRLFVGGTMYYIGVTAVLLFTTIGAAYGPTRAPVIGSGFHTACFSVGCSRIVLSLHSWADKNQRHSVARTSKRITYHSPSSSISTPFPGRDSPDRTKESTPPPDIEAGTIGITSNPSTTAVPLLQPPAANVRPRLPSIGRPPSPEQVLSEAHTLQHQQQRWPPRKSSLYPARHASQTSEVTG